MFSVLFLSAAAAYLQSEFVRIRKPAYSARIFSEDFSSKPKFGFDIFNDKRCMNGIKGHLQGQEKPVRILANCVIAAVNLQNSLIRDRQADLKNEANNLPKKRRKNGGGAFKGKLDLIPFCQTDGWSDLDELL